MKKSRKQLTSGAEASTMRSILLTVFLVAAMMSPAAAQRDNWEFVNQTKEPFVVAVTFNNGHTCSETLDPGRSMHCTSLRPGTYSRVRRFVKHVIARSPSNPSVRACQWFPNTAAYPPVMGTRFEIVSPSQHVPCQIRNQR
jgi:hypothetical protein